MRYSSRGVYIFASQTYINEFKFGEAGLWKCQQPNPDYHIIISSVSPNSIQFVDTNPQYVVNIMKRAAQYQTEIIFIISCPLAAMKI